MQQIACTSAEKWDLNKNKDGGWTDGTGTGWLTPVPR